MHDLPTDRLSIILDLVEGCMDEWDVSGAELASRAHLSRYHFDRLVSAALGEAPGAFRRRLLMERAAYQLTSRSISVIDVATTAGYGSAESFTRAFRRAYGRSPSTFRTASGSQFRLPSPNGVHFHPPGGLQLPDTSRKVPMDLLSKLVDHHLTVTTQIVERVALLADDVLDERLMFVDGIDSPPTLRATVTRLVTQLDMWNSVIGGSAALPAGPPVRDLSRRLAEAGPQFREVVLRPVLEGRGDDTFLDATCDPPQTFSYAGVLAHVLTFSAARRTLAIGALETAGVNDLGSGDPMQFVGGTGTDAHHIRRANR